MNILRIILIILTAVVIAVVLPLRMTMWLLSKGVRTISAIASKIN